MSFIHTGPFQIIFKAIVLSSKPKEVIIILIKYIISVNDAMPNLCTSDVIHI